MDTLNGIVCFIRSAESGSFAAAGRALGLTPAAVGKNVARLEASLGVRLFQRSTRRLSPREPQGPAGLAFRQSCGGPDRRMLTDGADGKASIELETRIIFDEPDAANQAATQGLGIALVAVPQALPYIERGLLRRVLPDWWVEGGDISIYYAAQKLLPRKTRVFVEHVVASFERDELAARFSAQHPAVL
jgi:DNA-binding transcriptional LysR family regulator